MTGGTSRSPRLAQGGLRGGSPSRDAAAPRPAAGDPDSGRVAGLDLGTRRIGVAVSDELRMTVRPLGVIEARGPKPDARALREMLEGLGVALLVAGVPLLPSGDEGPSAVRCRAQAADLARRLALPLALVDESDTTLEAQRILAERPKRRGPDVDALAAALLLEAWIADQGRLT